MKPLFEELDYCRTPMGDLVLQRRLIAALGDAEAFEVKLNDEYLMSSLFHDAEVALADLALGPLGGAHWTVVVGGLGLGYTAAATLKFKQMQRLVIIEALQPVIDWHRRELAPNGHLLNADPRCEFRHADFFALAQRGGFVAEQDHAPVDAILLDIDHTPRHVLAPHHAEFYTAEGVRRLAARLKPGGVFALWSNEPPDEAFLDILRGAFDRVEGRLIRFPNPLQDTTSTNGIYLAYRDT